MILLKFGNSVTILWLSLSYLNNYKSQAFCLVFWCC